MTRAIVKVQKNKNITLPMWLMNRFHVSVGDFVRLEYIDPETGDWLSLGAVQRYRGMEVTVPVSAYGVNVRTVFER